MLGRVQDWLYHHPYMALIGATMMWGANGVAARIAVGHVSPMALTSLRWIATFMAMALFFRQPMAEAWPVLRQRLVYLAVMGTIGFNGFAVPFYWGAHHTTAVNLTIIQGSIPVFVMLGALALYGTRVGILQVLGMAVTIAGIAVLAGRGDLALLASLDVNIGDLGMIAACLFYAAYTVGLRQRPKVSGLGFLGCLVVVAAITSVPPLVVEITTGSVMWPDTIGWLCVVFIGLFPSLVAQVMFMQAVERIGPGRAALFVNLVPVFGALFAVGILGEPFGAFHAVALTLVLGGILLAEIRRAGT